MIPVVERLPPADPESHGGEEIIPLVETRHARLEWITSRGEPSPEGFWYDQEWPEWVMLLRGEAVLEFEEGRLELAAGDSLTIPARLRHRVAAVSADAQWIALHHAP